MVQQLDVAYEFREDHRRVRDLLLDLRQAFRDRDVARSRAILGELNAFVGPHFRFEEESLYPALRPILGEYVDQLIQAHDGIIDTARQAAALVQKPALSEEDAQAGILGVMTIIPHVSDCDGLIIMLEKLEAAELSKIARNIQECRQAGLSLLDWADKVRGR